MSNAFARAYFKRVARAFEMWKTYITQDKHKEKIIRRTLEHFKMQNAKYLMAVMKKIVKRMLRQQQLKQRQPQLQLPF